MVVADFPISSKPSQRQPPLEARVGDLEGALHDVANALTVVLGWLETAEQKAAAHSSVRHAIGLARQRAQHGRSLALHAVGANDMPPEQPVTCDSFVQIASSGVLPQADRGLVRVEFRVAQDVRAAGVANHTQALQVLTNVLMNAVSFSPQGATVNLDATRVDAKTVRFLVQDEGPGFDAARAKDVFRGLSSSRKGGSGIGLRYAHQIAEKHGGCLRLLDPGPGAVFELSWPLNHARPSQMPGATYQKLQGLRVLVVEDDESVSMLLETALGAKGASVDTAVDQDVLNDLLTAGKYDAALVDLSPLQPDVVSSLRRIRNSPSQPKLVLITGSAASPAQAVLNEATAWVRKPFEISDVVSALLDS